MNISNKVCPCCGRKLELTAPSKKDHPEIMGISKNGIEFTPRRQRARLQSYTKRPDTPLTNDYGYPSAYENEHIDKLYGSVWGRFRKLVIPEVLTAERVADRLRKGGKDMYDPILIFSCVHCRSRLVLNENPYRLDPYMAYVIGTAIGLTIISLIAAIGAGMWWMLVLGVLCFGAYFGYRIWAGRQRKKIEEKLSNFVAIDEDEGLITPPHTITLDPSGIDSRFLHKTNILTLKTTGKDINLYITDIKDGKLFCAVCGSDVDRESFGDLARRTTEPFPVSFERIEIGSAKVTAVIDLPKKTEV